MSDQQTHVIVGASLAGAKAAETLRSEGFDGRVVLLGAEPDRPYERPPLSKQFLRGETAVEDTFVHDEHFYRDNDIELRVDTRVDEVNIRARTVTTEGGASIRYDRLLLQPARARAACACPAPGSAASTTSAACATAERCATPFPPRNCGRRRCGMDRFGGRGVDPPTRRRGRDHRSRPVPLAGVLGPEVGAVFRDLHAEHGVSLHLGETVHGFVGDTDVAGVRTATVRSCPPTRGRRGRCRTPYRARTRRGLDIDGGIAVDEFLQTNQPGVFAAGDVAAAWHPGLGRRVRVEHWANAKHQGVTAAKNMLGAGIAYDRQPYFFSDQYDFGLEYSGYASSWDRVVIRGDPATREFIVFYIADNRVVAAMNANVWDVAEPLQSLIATQRTIDDSRLVNPDVAIDTLERVA